MSVHMGQVLAEMMDGRPDANPFAALTGPRSPGISARPGSCLSSASITARSTPSVSAEESDVMNEPARIERDALGEVELPAEAAYGVHTERALRNFPITDVRLNKYPELIRALAMVKKAAALANRDLGAVRRDRVEAIIAVCEGIIAGRHHEPLPRRHDPGRRGHVDQHERQRGDRQPRPEAPRAPASGTTRAFTRTTT
jgi:Lyase